MSLLKVNEIQIFNGETVTITAPAVVTANDNTNAALRITQTGTGNALLVEDSPNPDSTPFVVKGDGTVIRGYTENVFSTGIQSVSTSAGAASISVGSFSASGLGAPIRLYHSRSGAVPTNTVLQSADELGKVEFYGADGSAYIQGASIFAAVDGTPGTNDMPGRLVFSTTADGASSPTERMRIDSAGNVGIGTTQNDFAKLELKTGTYGGSQAEDGVVLKLQTSEGGSAFSGGLTIQTSSGGSPTVSLVSTDDPTTRTFQPFIESSSTATNQYTKFLTAGTERMRIDSSGKVGIGTSSPSQKLDVTGNINATGALTLGTALAIAEGGTGATDAATARTNLDVDQAGTDNSTDVTLVTTSHDYLSITGQAITLGPIDLAADVTGNLPYASISGTPTLGTAAAEDVGYFATAAQGSLADSAVQPGDDANTLGSGAATDGYVLTADGAGGTAWEAASGGGGGISDGDKGDITVSSSGTVWTIDNSVVTNAKLSLSANDSNIKTALNASGSAPIYACRAWVNFNGTGTVAIRASGNVTSITDNGTGKYTVNFTTAMPDVNYSVSHSANYNETTTLINTSAINAPSTSSYSVACHADNGSSLFDCQIVYLQVFR